MLRDVLELNSLPRLSGPGFLGIASPESKGIDQTPDADEDNDTVADVSRNRSRQQFRNCLTSGHRYKRSRSIEKGDEQIAHHPNANAFDAVGHSYAKIIHVG